MKMDRHVLFEAYRLGILIGHLSSAELISKIDKMIAGTPVEDIPHIFFVLSLTSDRKRMLELLTDITKDVSDELPSCIVAGLLYKERYRYSEAELFEKAGRLALLIKHPHDEVAAEIKALKEKYEEVQQVYGFRFKRKKTLARILTRIEQELIETLSQYEKYADQFEQETF